VADGEGRQAALGSAVLFCLINAWLLDRAHSVMARLEAVDPVEARLDPAMRVRRGRVVAEGGLERLTAFVIAMCAAAPWPRSTRNGSTSACRLRATRVSASRG
jgi:hypothetical protein